MFYTESLWERLEANGWYGKLSAKLSVSIWLCSLTILTLADTDEADAEISNIPTQLYMFPEIVNIGIIIQHQTTGEHSM